MSENGWQPIETAPKDGTRILLGYSRPVFTGIHAVCGQWNDNKHARRPRPYWKHEIDCAGVSAMRDNQPSHWQPLPDPPTGATP